MGVGGRPQGGEEGDSKWRLAPPGAVAVKMARERWQGGQGARARQDNAGVHAPVCLAGMGQVEEKVKMREKGTEVHRHM